MAEREDEEKEVLIKIYSEQGELRHETPINEGSKRHVELGGDDYALLKFSVYEPIKFAIGDYADIREERLYICSLPQPAYNVETGGYDYELHLTPLYKLWGNKLVILNPGDCGETNFKYTDTISGHLELIMKCLRHHGFKFVKPENGAVDYSYEIDRDKDNPGAYFNSESKYVNYDGLTITEALDTICATYECEWWLEGNVLHLGKCERGSIIGYERNDNISDVRPSGRDGARKTRLYAFGSTENIPPYYRKRAEFEVTGYGEEGIIDEKHPLRENMFLPETLIDDPKAKVEVRLEGSVSKKFDDIKTGQEVKILSIQRSVLARGGTWDLLLEDHEFKITTRNVLNNIGGNEIALVLSVTYDNVYGERKTETRKGTITHIPAEEKEHVIKFTNIEGMPLVGKADEDSVMEFSLELQFKAGNAEWLKDFELSFAAYQPIILKCLTNYKSVEGLRVTNLSTGATGLGIWNKKHRRNDGINAVTLTVEGISLGVGDKFTIEPLNRLQLPAAWFSPIYGKATIDAIASSRLRLPVDTPYIDAIEGLTEIEAVEHVEFFDDVYPRQQNRVKEVWEWEHKEKDDDGGSRMYYYYFIDAEGIDFGEDCLIAGVDLRMKFTSGVLNGMTFGAVWRPDGIDGSNFRPCIEIVANEEYGRRLPDTILRPSSGDEFILLGWASERVYGEIIDRAEKELLEKATEWLDTKLTEGETYDCPLLPQYAYENGLPVLGQRVRIFEPSLFPKKDFTSRVIGLDYPLDYPFDNPTVTIGEKIPRKRLEDIEEQINANGSISDFSTADSRASDEDFGDMVAVIQVRLLNDSDQVVFNDLGQIVGGLPETWVEVTVNGVHTKDFTVSIPQSYDGLGFQITGPNVRVTSADLSMQLENKIQLLVTINVEGRTATRNIAFTLIKRRGNARYNLQPCVSNIRINQDGTVFPEPKDFRCEVMMNGEEYAGIMSADQMMEAGLYIEWQVDGQGEWMPVEGRKKTDEELGEDGDEDEENIVGALDYDAECESLVFRLVQGATPIDYQEVGFIEAGVEGKSLDNLTNLYLAGKSRENAPEGTWVGDVAKSGFSAELPYLWGKERLFYNTGYTKETEPHFMAQWTGRVILGIEEFYLATETGEKPVFEQSKWFTDQMETGFGEELQFLWNVERITYLEEPFVELTGPILIGHYGRDGSDATTGGGFTSFVFKRSSQRPDKPLGGSYSKPVPLGWSDGIPEPDDRGNPVWMSTRLFTYSGEPPQDKEWSEPRKVADTADIDYEFSAVEVNPGTPDTHPQNWHDHGSDSGTFEDHLYNDDIWMAIQRTVNDVKMPWDIVRIKGERGADGIDGKDGDSPYLLDLDNEMAGILIGPDKKPKGELPESDSTVYFGSIVDTGWTFSVNGVNCTAEIDKETGHLKITDVVYTKLNIYAEVTAKKRGHTDLTARMNLYLVENGVLYSIEPDVNSVSKYKDGSLSTDKITVTKYVTDGINPRTETTDHWLRAIICRNGVYEDPVTVSSPGTSFGSVSIDADVTSVEFYLYNTNPDATTRKLLDKERVPIVSDGIDGLSSYLLDLDNEMAGIIIDYQGNPKSELPESNATVYFGGKIDTGWKFYAQGINCGVTIDEYSGYLKVYAVSYTTEPIRVEVTAKKDGHDDIYATMNLYLVENGVIYSLEPSVNSVLLDSIEDLLSENEVSVTIYVTDGATPRKEANNKRVTYTLYDLRREPIRDESGAVERELINMGASTGTVKINPQISAVSFSLYDTDPPYTLLDRERVPVITQGSVISEERITRIQENIRDELKVHMQVEISNGIQPAVFLNPATLTLESNKSYTVRVTPAALLQKISSLSHTKPTDATWLTVTMPDASKLSDPYCEITILTGQVPAGAKGAVHILTTFLGGKTYTATISYDTVPQFSMVDNRITLNGISISGDLKGDPGTNGKNGEDGFTWRPNVDESGELSWSRNNSQTPPASRNINGYSYVPNVDSEGNLSWSISKNPGAILGSVYIKGPQGLQGPQGPQGNPGTNGKDGVNGINGQDGHTFRPTFNPETGQLNFEVSTLVTQVNLTNIVVSGSLGSRNFNSMPSVSGKWMLQGNSNAPGGVVGYWWFVEQHYDNSSSITQIAQRIDQDIVWRRRMSSSGWGSWVQDPTKSEVDAKLSSADFTWNKLQSKPNTVSGFGITDLSIINNQVRIGNVTSAVIPTNNNQLTNGAGYQTENQVENRIVGKGYTTLAAVQAQGYLKEVTWDKIKDAPKIPSKISDLSDGVEMTNKVANLQTNIQRIKINGNEITGSDGVSGKFIKFEDTTGEDLSFITISKSDGIYYFSICSDRNCKASWNTGTGTCSGGNATGTFWGQSWSSGGTVMGNLSGVGSINLANSQGIRFDVYGNILNDTSTGSYWYVGTSTTNIGLAVTKDNNVGIGTSSPSYKLDVYGSARFNSTTYLSGCLPTSNDGCSLGTDGQRWYEIVGNLLSGASARVTSYLGVGASPNTRYTFAVNGTGYFSGNITAPNLSDKRLKKRVKDADCLSVIKALGKVKTFRYKKRARRIGLVEDCTTIHTGLLYNEAKKAEIPGFTGEHEESSQGTRYGYVNWLSPDYQANLLGTVQQLIDRVEKLETENKQLKELIKNINQ